MSYKDPEKQRAYNRAYMRKNYPQYAAKQKEYRQQHAGNYAEWQRQWRSDNPRDNLVILARARAKKGGYPCTITVADLEWPTHCPIFGIELDYNATPTGQRKHAKRDAFPTLDKRDPFLGYTPGNVFVISYKANRLKQDATIGQLRALLRYAEGAA